MIHFFLCFILVIGSNALPWIHYRSYVLAGNPNAGCDNVIPVQAWYQAGIDYCQGADNFYNYYYMCNADGSATKYTCSENFCSGTCTPTLLSNDCPIYYTCTDEPEPAVPATTPIAVEFAVLTYGCKKTNIRSLKYAPASTCITTRYSNSSSETFERFSCDAAGIASVQRCSSSSCSNCQAQQPNEYDRDCLLFGSYDNATGQVVLYERMVGCGDWVANGPDFSYVINVTQDCVYSWSEWTDCSADCGDGSQSRIPIVATAASPDGVACPSPETRVCNLGSCNRDCVYTWDAWSACTAACGDGIKYRTPIVITQSTGDGLACPTFESTGCFVTPCLQPVDCSWTLWSEWSVCNGTCPTGGYQIRLRSKIPAQNGGMDCTGSDRQATECNVYTCAADVDCVWSGWTEDSCSVTCGDGTKTRSRTKSGPVGNGLDCTGLPTETVACNLGPCVTCEWNAWGAWSTCTELCGGGTMTRTRTPNPADGTTCVGDPTETINCNTATCGGEPIPCSWNPWSDWSGECSTCSGGSQSRFRTKNVAQNGGADCTGSATQTTTCPTIACPVDCVWNAWNAWSACTVECGNGTQTRTRSSVPEVNGGLPCSGPDTETYVCNTIVCLGTISQPCTVNEWNEWSACSSSCNGTQVRIRTVNEAQNSGVTCTAALEESRSCNLDGCPCVYNAWGAWGVCSVTCGGGIQTRLRTSSTSSCPSQSQSAPCNVEECITPATPIDCTWNNWEEWSTCTVSCDGGSRYRVRSKNAAQNGGLTCSGASEEVEPCNTSPCGTTVCIYAAWTEWTACTVACDSGTQTRSKTGNANCSPATVNEEINCNTEPCSTPDVAVDCTWNQWSSYTTCSATCGGGTQSRSRSKNEAQNGGEDCSGATDEVISCNNFECPPTDSTIPPTNCLYYWSEWTQCSSSCDAGTQTRIPIIATGSANGGLPCPEPEVQTCSIKSCDVNCVYEWTEWTSCSACYTSGVPPSGTSSREPIIITPSSGDGAACPVAQTKTCPAVVCGTVDCLYEWNDWSACTKTCGSGTQSRTYEIIIQPVLGKPCPEFESRSCNTQSCAVNCVFTWSAWSACTSDCGYGTQTRTAVISTASSGGGALCPAPQLQSCYSACPPVDCTYSTWSSWSNCDATCDGGYQTRTRTTSGPFYGGAACTDNTTETITCNTAACVADEDCSWNAWSSFSDCDCDGTQTITKTRTANQPQGSGLPCIPADGVAVEDCSASCAIDCEYYPWSPYSACTASCDGGTQTRTRTIRINESGGGQPCDGNDTENINCNTEACEATSTPVDCSWNTWGAWSTCTATCGGGTQTRIRSSNTAQNGGAACVGASSETSVCNNYECSTSCVWEEWGAWSSCNATCGGGYTSRTRSKVPPDGACTGSAEEISTCNTGTCSAVPIACTYNTWSEWSACSVSCGGGVKTRFRTTNAEQNGGTPCTDTLQMVETCSTTACAGSPDPVDCIYIWDSWTTCSVSCGDGSRYRSPTILSPATNGGTCPTTQLQSCNLGSCDVACAFTWSDWGSCSICSTLTGQASGTQARYAIITQPATGLGTACPDPTVQTQACPTGTVCIKACTYSWNEWSACSVQCGTGTQSRTPEILIPATDNSCPTVESRPCTQPSCTVDCVSTWSEWTVCDAACGDGTRYKTPEITTVAAGGVVCPSIVSENCTVRACTAADVSASCLYSWSEWSGCSTTIGVGTRYRYPILIKAAVNGGSCPAPQEENCQLASEDVNCKFVWNDWSVCSPCGAAGTQSRDATIITASRGDGIACPTTTNQTCTGGTCPSVPVPDSPSIITTPGSGTTGAGATTGSGSTTGGSSSSTGSDPTTGITGTGPGSNAPTLNVVVILFCVTLFYFISI